MDLDQLLADFGSARTALTQAQTSDTHAQAVLTAAQVGADTTKQSLASTGAGFKTAADALIAGLQAAEANL